MLTFLPAAKMIPHSFLHFPPLQKFVQCIFAKAPLKKSRTLSNEEPVERLVGRLVRRLAGPPKQAEQYMPVDGL